MLHSQFWKRYQAKFSIQSAGDLGAFFSRFPQTNWAIDDIRVFFNKEVLQVLEKPVELFHNTLVVMVSGKRCSGKDTISEHIRKQLIASDYNCEVTHFADAFKKLFCEQAGLDLNKMLTDRVYKEQHREKMTEFYNASKHISWSNVVADKIVEECKVGFSTKKVFIISDLRHQNEITTLRSVRRKFPHLNLVLVRIKISDEARGQRGWVRGPVDSDESETNLDEFDDWDYAFDNSQQGMEHGEAWVKNIIIPLLKNML